MGVVIDPRIRRARFLRGLPPIVEVAVRPPPRTITREELARERLIDAICRAGRVSYRHDPDLRASNH